MFRGLLLWLLIMAAETVHGILRGMVLVPQVGETMASRIGWPIGMALVLGITLVLIRWTGLSRNRDLFRLGAIWAVLTAIFEVGIGLLRGFDAARIWAEANPATGGLMLPSLVVMAVAPWVAVRLRRPRTADEHSGRRQLHIQQSSASARRHCGRVAVIDVWRKCESGHPHGATQTSALYNSPTVIAQRMAGLNLLIHMVATRFGVRRRVIEYCWLADCGTPVLCAPRDPF